MSDRYMAGWDAGYRDGKAHVENRLLPTLIWTFADGTTRPYTAESVGHGDVVLYRRLNVLNDRINIDPRD